MEKGLTQRYMDGAEEARVSDAFALVGCMVSKGEKTGFDPMFFMHRHDT